MQALGNMAQDLERVAATVCHAFDVPRNMLFSQFEEELDENAVQARAAFVLIAFGYGATKREIKDFAKLRSQTVVIRWHTMAMRRWSTVSFRTMLFDITGQLGLVHGEVYDAV